MNASHGEYPPTASAIAVSHFVLIALGFISSVIVIPSAAMSASLIPKFRINSLRCRFAVMLFMMFLTLG
jgi:hypothetical protein